MEDGFAKTSEEVLKYFGTNEEVGLTADQVKNFQAKYGPNGKLNNFHTLSLSPCYLPNVAYHHLWKFHCCIL